MIPQPYAVQVIPEMYGRYINLRTGQAMTVCQEWRIGCSYVHSVALSDANGFEWVGSVGDFYENWVHEDIHDRTEARP